MRGAKLLLSSLALANLASSEASLTCKCAPSDPCWPSVKDFEALNQTVSGRLLQRLPPGSACYKDQPNYSTSACQDISASWFSSPFHASDPVSIGWPWWANNTCPPLLPNGTSVNGDPDAEKKGCSIGGYPAYVLNATDISDIQAVIRFANENNIRLNVKSTGHSFQGRSTAFGSLSIWTHNLRGAQWHDGFQADNCSETTTTQIAVTLAAGERVRDAYEFAAAHNSVVVAGFDQDVGVMGWFSGGGHGPLSSSYGMGVDNVLQVKMVTATGEFITVNACQNTDLFWALRGGGGSTFGVVTEVTMKAYMTPHTTRHSFLLTGLPNTTSSTFFDIVARVFSELPRLKAGGLQGNIILDPTSADADSWILEWEFNLYDKPNGTAESLFAPIDAWLSQENGTRIFYNTSVLSSPDFFTMWNSTSGVSTVATTGLIQGSWLLPASSLMNTTRLASALKNITTPGFGNSQVALEIPLVANNDRPSLDVSITPAWREAVVHFMVMETFHDWDTFNQAKPTLDRMTYQRVGKLRELAPKSGAYMNEADPYDPDWQNSFWGPNYPQLKASKDKYDPNSALWCLSCVGSEDWVEVQQPSGTLCRVSD